MITLYPKVAIFALPLLFLILLLLASNTGNVNSSLAPTVMPTTSIPTSVPTSSAPTSPSSMPTMQPSTQPSRRPSSQPSEFPSSQPSSQPTSMPSKLPQDSEYAYKVSLFMAGAWVTALVITWFSEYLTGKTLERICK
jgi:hypothetical protein